MKNPTYPIYIAMGKCAKRLRVELEISQSEMAEATGLSKKSINNFENGRHNIRLIHLVKLAKYLDMPLSRLIRKTEQSMKVQTEERN